MKHKLPPKHEGQEEDHGTRCGWCDRRSFVSPCGRCEDTKRELHELMTRQVLRISNRGLFVNTEAKAEHYRNNTRRGICANQQVS